MYSSIGGIACSMFEPEQPPSGLEPGMELRGPAAQLSYFKLGVHSPLMVEAPVASG